MTKARKGYLLHVDFCFLFGDVQLEIRRRTHAMTCHAFYFQSHSAFALCLVCRYNYSNSSTHAHLITSHAFPFPVAVCLLSGRRIFILYVPVPTTITLARSIHCYFGCAECRWLYIYKYIIYYNISGKRSEKERCLVGRIKVKNTHIHSLALLAKCEPDVPKTPRRAGYLQQ